MNLATDIFLSQDLVARLGERGEVVVQVARLDSAARGVVLGVEVQHQLGTLKFFEGACVAMLVRSGEGRSLLSDLKGGNRGCHDSKNTRMPVRFAGVPS